jgi:hypothetical protein
LLVWLGGACDASVTIEVRPNGRSVSVDTLHEPAQGSEPTMACTAVGLLRSIEVTFDHEVSPAEMALVPPESPFSSGPPAATPTPKRH